MAAPRNVSGKLFANAAGAGNSTVALPFSFAEGSDAILQLGHYATAGNQITGITIGGVSGTVIVQQNKLGGGNNSLRSYLFRGIPAGTSSVVISYNAGTDHYTTFAVSEWASGVLAAASPVDTPTIATAFATGGSLTVTTAAATEQASSLVFGTYLPDTSRANNSIAGPTEPGWSVLWVEQDSINVTGSTGAWIERTTIGTQAATWTIGTSGSRAAHVFAIKLNTGGGDTTAPVLSSPVGTTTGSTTATVGATTDEGNGTLYVSVTTSATQPSIAQIKAGQDNGGAAAAYASSQSVTTTGAKTFSATGLAASTTYYAHLVHTDAAANDSSRVSSSSFTTSAPSDTTPPTLTSPVGTATGTTTATVGATTDESNGTMYVVVTTSATQPSVAQIKAGQNNGGTAAAYAESQSITTTGAKTFSATGLTASTVYYAHVVHTDAAANDSNRVTSSSFTTSAVTPNISGASDTTPSQGASLTLTGTNFGASQGTGSVAIGGVTQTVTSWGDTSVTVNFDRGTNKSGVAVNAVLTANGGATSNSFSLTPQPPAGWQFVNIGTPDAVADNRLTATPDLASGNQVEWGDVVGTGTVTVADDGTFSADPGVTSFDFRVHNDGDGWGSVATQTIGTTSAVGNSMSMSYAVQAVVGASQSMSYGLLNAVGASLSQAYALQAAVGASVFMSYQVGDAPASRPGQLNRAMAIGVGRMMGM